MTEEKEFRRGPSEYARKGMAEGQTRPRRKTRFLFKLIGLCLVIVAGWWAYRSYTQGQLIDPLDPAQQQKALDQAKKDLTKLEEKSIEVSGKVAEWARHNFDELKKRMKGEPPETREDVKKLVDETKVELESTDTPKTSAKPTLEPKPTQAAPPSGPFEEAQQEYRKGQEAYILTDPSAPQAQVQGNLRTAEPHFSRCLDLLDDARAKGVNGAAIDSLEQSAARRLYDCRKRMTIKP